MPISNYLIGLAPGLLRNYRTGLLLDLPEILEHLPEGGRLLDVGCGTGLVSYEIARLRPDLDVTGIDIDKKSIERANNYNKLPNVHYEARLLGEMEGQYGCISFMDLLHHVEDADATNLMAECVHLLEPGGWLFVKDIDRRGGYFSYFMDRFVSFATPVRLRTMEGIKNLTPPNLQPSFEMRKWKFPQPHLYLVFNPVAG
jgi:SAM-dependent methyltransferase